MRRFLTILLASALVLLDLHCTTTSVVLPGRLDDGRVRLPNGWMLSPAGAHVDVGELPLNMIISPDDRYAVVTNNGTEKQSLSIIDIASWQVVQTVPLHRSWLGLKFIDGGKRFLVSGGNDNRVWIYAFAQGKATLSDSIVMGRPWPDEKIWVAGLDVDEQSGTVYIASRENDCLYIADLAGHSIRKTIQLPATPYTCLVSRYMPYTYISLWGGGSIAVLDRASGELVKNIQVGDHPSDMVESAGGDLLYVANANNNTVSVVSTTEGRVLETISTALFPGAPDGSTPNSLALSNDGTRLYIANADNNYVAVISVSRRGQSASMGMIPTGWYPTTVRGLAGTGDILVANAKGGASAPNPLGPDPLKPRRREQYIGSLFHGTVSRIPPPDQAQLATYTKAVYDNSPYTEARRLNPGTDEHNPVPAVVGGTSPIKHVFYVIKENRTYDQVFGDMPQGNGDSSLCLFPARIAPNHHALAGEFILLDNFYADAEVSADGHNWSMGAYATDYVEKSWPTSYGGRGGEYEFEGGYPDVYPSAGYLWDNCARHAVTYRTYGEFAKNRETPQDTARALMPSLEGHVAPFYQGWDLTYSDVQRARDWAKEFDEYEKNGGLPSFQIIKLPNDHTEGTRRGSLTPYAFVAQNDLALGMIIERLSHSRYWKESAVFVVEDDAQNGPDHVDAHRTVALVISPYTKRRFVDSDLYSTSSMVRTMELILGLPPLSQFDAAANPMYNSFTAVPDTTPYRCRPATVDLEERNPLGSPGQSHSDLMDFSREDAAPDIELNQIIWKSIRGADSEMPAPVRSAFVRVITEEAEEDD